MTDYFALLEQSRAPWLDPEQLREAFHRKTLLNHPDAQWEATGYGAFTEINEAYQVLRDPKRRLQHLLTLMGETPASRAAATPRDVEELFPAVAGLTREAEVVLQRVAGSSSALSLSLVRPELLRVRGEIEQMLGELRRLHGNAEDALRSADMNSTAVLHDLYLRFSYLSRWIAELEEKQLRLSI
jgi:curved DNA-binding protein CbpA